MNRENDIDMQEKEIHKEIIATLLSDTGLGYGEGSISVEAQLETGELSSESLRKAIEIIRRDKSVFVDVEAPDDGCGDGRPTGRIYRFLNKETEEVQTFKRSVPRAKIFGGGLIVASSMWRAVVGQTSEKNTLESDRVSTADMLKNRDVSFGAHTADSHTGETSCGCGAIDKYREISDNITVFRPEIEGSLQVLYGDSYEENQVAIQSVFESYETLDDEYYRYENGRKTMSFIESQGAVVKELTRGHLEDLVVLNDVKGTTLDQDALRGRLQTQGLSSDIQTFVVDVWRGRMYADLVADEAAKQHDVDRESAYNVAFADFLIRTCATSATLTAGDQPVIHRAEAHDLAA